MNHRVTITQVRTISYILEGDVATVRRKALLKIARDPSAFDAAFQAGAPEVVGVERADDDVFLDEEEGEFDD